MIVFNYIVMAISIIAPAYLVFFTISLFLNRKRDILSIICGIDYTILLVFLIVFSLMLTFSMPMLVLYFLFNLNISDNVVSTLISITALAGFFTGIIAVKIVTRIIPFLKRIRSRKKQIVEKKKKES